MPKSTRITATKDAYRIFIGAVTNETTRKNYENQFLHFRQYANISASANELLTMKAEKVENLITDYLQLMNKNGKSSAYMRIVLSTLKRFYLENRAENYLNWKWLSRRIPKNQGKTKDRDYTKEELQTVLKRCDTRKRAILLLLMSGIRKGAIVNLRVGGLSKLSYKDIHLYKIKVYEGDSEEYHAFLTPEASKALDVYLENRKLDGEEITKDSPLIRDVYNPLNVKEAKKVTTSALDMLMTRLLRSAGLRVTNGAENRQRRHEVMLFHGIRKFVTRALENAGVKVTHAETLLGHDIGIREHYIRPTESELLAEFVKAIPNLSLGDEDRLRSENVRLEAENAETGKLRALLIKQSDKLQETENTMSEQLTLYYNENQALKDFLAQIAKKDRRGRAKGIT